MGKKPGLFLLGTTRCPKHGCSPLLISSVSWHSRADATRTHRAYPSSLQHPAHGICLTAGPLRGVNSPSLRHFQEPQNTSYVNSSQDRIRTKQNNPLCFASWRGRGYGPPAPWDQPALRAGSHCSASTGASQDHQCNLKSSTLKCTCIHAHVPLLLH